MASLLAATNRWQDAAGQFQAILKLRPGAARARATAWSRPHSSSAITRAWLGELVAMPVDGSSQRRGALQSRCSARAGGRRSGTGVCRVPARSGAGSRTTRKPGKALSTQPPDNVFDVFDVLGTMWQRHALPFRLEGVSFRYTGRNENFVLVLREITAAELQADSGRSSSRSFVMLR